MPVAYFDLTSGISGDMLLAALVDAGVDLAAIQAGIDSLGLPSCRLVSQEVKRKGFRAVKIDVEHEPEHAHRHLHHITDMIDGSSLSAAQKDLAKRIFTRLGEAEAKVHGTTIRKVHFHEVGAVDSIADIVGAAIGLDLLGVDRILCSPVPTGTGHVEIAHGRVGIPAPATAELLQGIPLAPSSIEAELTTPTGAAIVATVVDGFGPLPAMNIRAIGYGAGSRDLAEQANLLRLFVGESMAPAGLEADQVWVLETTLDNIPGEWVGHCTARLLEAGALDVYTTPVQMKKNRPGVQLTVLCEVGDDARIESILFRETPTLGVRRWLVARHKLARSVQSVETPWGAVDVKVATLPDGTLNGSPEFESCRQLAATHSVALRDIYEAARQAFRAAHA